MSTLRRLAVVAGSGSLVVEAVAFARRAGWPLLVMALAPRSDLGDVPVMPLDLSDPMGAFAAMREFGATDVCLVGGVHIPDAARERLATLMPGGAAGPLPVGDAGLSALGATVEKLTGARLVGIHELLPELLAPVGVIGGPEPDGVTLDAARFALQTARAIGALDIGQAAVCAGRRVIAVEDIAGTDALIARVGEYRQSGIAGDGKARLLLAKAMKPHQPMFVDLPAIGPATVSRAAMAGIATIAVEAGRSLVLDRALLVDAAMREGVTVLGLTLEDD
ncbi:MAG TPA: UDP-2,3-diacylglucosamine diphosphatase LpxI [Devosiaceae bacterium]